MATDRIFSQIEAIHGSRPWGEVLDAGTGRLSLSWLLGLDCVSRTAVTADTKLLRLLEPIAATEGHPADRLLLGDWSDSGFLPDTRFDVVLADYLIGAVDRAAPYFQTALLQRLRQLTRGRLYIVGVEPALDVPPHPGSELLAKIIRVRDACYLLADKRPYREYPLQWVLSSLAQVGFDIIESKRLPLVHRQNHIDRQVGAAKRQLSQVADQTVAEALRTHLEALRVEAVRYTFVGGIPLGFDYVICAE